jgi:SAM-dependent methyltransferase
LDKLSKFSKALCCPECKTSLDSLSIYCDTCKKSYRKYEGKLIFDETWFQVAPAKRDWLNSLKEQFKRKLTWIYPIIVDVLSPVAPTFSPRKYLPKELLSNGLIANLGCGTTSFGKKILNLDLGAYQNVDIVASIDNLPFKNESLDGIINVAVLEHVSNPEKVVAEFQRVLKPNGLIICFIPFIQGIHASPYDFQRYTPEGIRILFKNYHIQFINSVGPTSGFLWIFQEWLALTLSFGIRPLYKTLVPITWILSPIKYLDYLLQYHPMAANISSGYYFLAMKK